MSKWEGGTVAPRIGERKRKSLSRKRRLGREVRSGVTLLQGRKGGQNNGSRKENSENRGFHSNTPVVRTSAREE